MPAKLNSLSALYIINTLCKLRRLHLFFLRARKKTCARKPCTHSLRGVHSGFFFVARQRGSRTPQGRACSPPLARIFQSPTPTKKMKNRLPTNQISKKQTLPPNKHFNLTLQRSKLRFATHPLMQHRFKLLSLSNTGTPYPSGKFFVVAI